MNRLLIFFILFLFISFTTGAGPATLPARIGGTVTVNGVKLVYAASTGYIFRVTGRDGKGFSPPAEDKDGLNKKGLYIIDIPIYNPSGQPEGAKPESTAVIHVFRNGIELIVDKPSRGEFTVGKGGTITSIDLVLFSLGQGTTKANTKRQ